MVAQIVNAERCFNMISPAGGKEETQRTLHSKSANGCCLGAHSVTNSVTRKWNQGRIFHRSFQDTTGGRCRKWVQQPRARRDRRPSRVNAFRRQVDDRTTAAKLPKGRRRHRLVGPRGERNCCLCVVCFGWQTNHAQSFGGCASRARIAGATGEQRRSCFA